MYFWTCLFGGVCPLQEWPSLSWCCWPVWTRAPTHGSTRLSPAACQESCKICSTVGQDLDAGAPCLTTLPPHTPPPPRTACTDKDWWAGERDTQRLERHAWVHTRPLQGHTFAHNSADVTASSAAAWERTVTTSTRCFQHQRTAVFSPGLLFVITCVTRPSSKDGCHWRCQHHS